jgi:hypothetical protein
MTPDQELRVKASTVVTERIIKLPGGWDLVKGLSQRKADIREMILGVTRLTSNYSTLKPHL